ncbi:hypothetical protein RRSWK_02802 [Rhodopirellula sp. SWK7]|nr:hypothetical protein RRSWK_02802 [Rhodopirellula sp. SWK7]
MDADNDLSTAGWVCQIAGIIHRTVHFSVPETAAIKKLLELKQ